ncbi:MAG TPA: amidohydrolase family protein [Terriglobia bacterium]|nr:amidohydrolase family protein [Terriglobia bacterium]
MTQSRREFLASIAAAGVGALLPTSIRIDIHHHIVPPSLLQALGPQRLAGASASWTPAKGLEALDQGGVSTGMTSIAPAGDPFNDPSTAVRLCRECNEYAGRLAADHRGRFGVFASLPLPNIDGSLREIEYAFDTLKTDGIALFTSYGDKWLGDPAFNPVFEELNRRNAVVYTHPNTANCCRNLLPNVGDGAIEWGTDTTRAITQMIFGGAAARYPNVRMIFSHGGGTMPFLVERFAGMARSAQFAPKFPQGFGGAAAKFYYDTAQVANPAAMSALSKVVPVSQIVFGTDYPFRTPAEHVKGLKECGVFRPKDLQAIDQNALRLLPKFRKE